MAKKKEELSYLQMPLPQSGKAYRTTKRSWHGFNLKETVDTGELSFENNISTYAAPYLTPAPKPNKIYSDDNISSNDTIYPIGLYGFDDFLLYLYRINSTIYVDYIRNGVTYTGTITKNAKNDYPRCIVQFNVYDVTTDTLTGEFKKRLLIFPDKVAMDFDIAREFKGISANSEPPQDADTNYIYGNTKGGKVWEYNGSIWEDISDSKEQFKVDFMEKAILDDGETFLNVVEIDEFRNEESPYTPIEEVNKTHYQRNTFNSMIYKWNGNDWHSVTINSMPNIKYATVHLSRLFGVDDGRIYASGFNDYANWNLDTVDEYNESNAWCSPTQSNSKADGNFTGITTFQNHVICFKRDFMHEIYNTKNPFRVQDIYAEGAVDNRTIQDVDGKLIFVSSDNVKVYTGGNPRIISYKLGLSSYDGAVSGTDGRNYYLYIDKKIFVFDTLVGEWSVRQTLPESDGNTAKIRDIISFAHNKNGMYCLSSFGSVFKLDTNDYTHDWAFETDLMTNNTVDIKHIRKIGMLADIKEGASFKVYCLYDDEKFNESSHLVYDSKGRYGKTGQAAIRIKPKMTAHYGIKLHVEGTGYVKLHELELISEPGGDLYL